MSEYEPTEKGQRYVDGLAALILWVPLLLWFFLSDATLLEIVIAAIGGGVISAAWYALAWMRRLKHALATVDARLAAIESKLRSSSLHD